jgi:hypothetical protein
MNKSEPAALRRAILRVVDEWLAAKFGPVFTWGQIRDCIRHNEELSDWIKEYLVGCADRMLSVRARQSKDTRKELPWIFGFSGIKGGLDPFQALYRDRLKRGFACHFAHWILEGKEPEDAFVKARRDIYGNELLVKSIHPRHKRNQKQRAAGEEKLNFSDKQLERDLQEEFQLKKLPRTKQEWLLESHRYFERLAHLIRPDWNLS